MVEMGVMVVVVVVAVVGEEVRGGNPHPRGRGTTGKGNGRRGADDLTPGPGAARRLPNLDLLDTSMMHCGPARCVVVRRGVVSWASGGGGQDRVGCGKRSGNEHG